MKRNSLKYSDQYDFNYIDELKEAIVFLGLFTLLIDALIGVFWICDTFIKWLLG